MWNHVHVHVARVASVAVSTVAVVSVEAAFPVDSVAAGLVEVASVEIDSVEAAPPVTASVVATVPSAEVMVLVQAECVETVLCKLKLRVGSVAAPRVTVLNVN